jgi:hypothetical protein
MKYACTDCRKKFRNESALNMHVAHVHGAKVKSVQPPAATIPVRATGQRGFWSTCFASFVGSLMALTIAGAVYAASGAVPESATKIVKAVWLAAFH